MYAWDFLCRRKRKEKKRRKKGRRRENTCSESEGLKILDLEFILLYRVQSCTL